MKFVNWIGAAILVVAIATAAQQVALAYTSDAPQTFAVARPVNPSSLSPKHPYKVALSGAASACQHLSAKGMRVRMSCTTDCTWDAALLLADAGFAIPYVDGGIGLGFPDGGFVGTFAETTDGNQLPGATPEYTALPPTLDSVCYYSASAGTAYVAETYP